MNIFLTLDYELFFGEKTGTVRKCLIDPTDAMLQIAENHNVKLVFFVDIGYVSRMHELLLDAPELIEDLELVNNHLKLLHSKGHDLQLHIHPHWESSTFENGEWKINSKGKYKLSDYSKAEARQIILKYASVLESIKGVKANAFRAGGWCIQPFEHISDGLNDAGIRIDSSVFAGGKFTSGEYSFDFSAAPSKDRYRFNSDVCKEEDGPFTEYPISSRRYSPLFYWRLYILGRLNPNDHKMLGDGLFLAQPGRKKSVLTSYTWNHVSCDGYYASVLNSVAKEFRMKGKENLVIIGHPKSFTRFSLKKMDSFIRNHSRTNHFKTFAECNEDR
jgi:hypothetical protein